MRDVYLPIKGPDIKGDASDNLNENAIEIESWSAGSGMAVGGSRSASGSATVSRPDFSEIIISKTLDSSSPHILQNLIKGTTFDEMKIFQYRAAKDARIPFLEITMEECILSSYSMSTGGGPPSESFSINFGKISYKYLDTSKDKGTATQPKTIGYSRIKNAKL